MEGTRISSEDFARFVRQVYRLFKIGTFHLLNNEAVSQTIEQSGQVFRELGDLGFERLSVLFLADTVFVNGTLLKAKREVYESAQELAALLFRAGFNQFTIDTAVDDQALRDALAIVAAQLQMADDEHPIEVPEQMPKAAQLTLIDPKLLDDLVSTELTAQDRTGRTYASALVLMRYQFDALKAGEYIPPKQLKRLAQQLVLLGEKDNPAFLGVTRMRNAFDDEAGRAVNTAILAVATAREVTDDVRTLSRVAMAALMLDVGRPRAAGMGRDDGEALPVIPRLDADQLARLPASTAAVLAYLGRLHDDSLHRIVCGFEAQWRHVAGAEALPYPSAQDARIEASIIRAAHRFNLALGFDVKRQRRATPDEAIDRLLDGVEAPIDQLCADLLLQATGLVPRGTVVRLGDGSTAVVTHNNTQPGRYGLPKLLVFADADGSRIAPHELDLARPTEETMARGGIVERLLDTPVPDDLARGFSTVERRERLGRAFDGAAIPPERAPTSVPRATATPAVSIAAVEEQPAPGAQPPESPAFTGEDPVVSARDGATPTAGEATRALERILGEYFHEPTDAPAPDENQRAEHRLASVPPQLLQALGQVGPTDAHPTASGNTLEPTQDVGDHAASRLLQQYFPDASSPGTPSFDDDAGPARAAGDSVRDTLVDGLPNAEEMLREHFGGDRTPARPAPVLPRTTEERATTRDALVREYLGEVSTDATSETTREVSDAHGDALLAAYRDVTPPAAPPAPPVAEPAPPPVAAASTPATPEAGATIEVGAEHADMLLHDYLESSLDEDVSDPTLEDEPEQQATPTRRVDVTEQMQRTSSRRQPAPSLPVESETTRPTPDTKADDLLRRYLSDAEIPGAASDTPRGRAPRPAPARPKPGASTDDLLRQYLNDKD